MKTLIAVMLAILISFSALSVMPTAYATGTTYNVSTAQQLADACTAINQSGGEATINLNTDLSGNGAYIGITKSDAVVTVIGNGHTLSCTMNPIYVSGGATVNLGDGNSELILTCADDNDNPGIVYVLDGGICNMYDGVTLKDHKGQNYYGGGVTVKGGTFHMYGGTIDNCGIEGGSVCYGGGVAVINSGIFIMDDGTISNCYVDSDYIDDFDPSHCFTAMGGGVFVTDGSTFTMNGGTITKCSATNFGGGVAIVSAESYNNDSEYRQCGMGNIKSTATINGGTISFNEAGEGAGVFASGYFYSFAAPFGSYNPSGIGVTDHPGLCINGGVISSNEADDMGGGVLIAMLRDSVKAQIHNAVITGNEAYDGAGVENYGYWTQLDIDGCTITGNQATTNGGGVMASSNSSNGYTTIKNTVIEDNTSGDRGAGVYYDANSKLQISGKNIIKGNTYNGKKNDLNILSSSKPVYVIGDLTGSQIGLSDPTLWDDGKEDTAEDAVSTIYLTKSYKSNNASLDPMNAFFSDHASWYPDYSDVDANEVRLFRKVYDVNYHINNNDMDDIYADEIFTPYVTNHVVRDGEEILEFHNIPQLKDPDGYVFKGWYYDQNNNNDTRPIEFGTAYEVNDKYETGVDIYAHWEKVEKIEQEKDIDNKDLPSDMKDNTDNKYYYDSFGLFGVQLRPDNWIDENTTVRENGGLRFATSIGEQLLKDVDDLSEKKVESEDGYLHNVEYGFVTASKDTTDKVVNDPRFNINKATYKLQYKGKDVNGVDTLLKDATTEQRQTPDNFRYVTNVDCTSQSEHEGRVYGGNDAIKIDHRDCNAYRIATFVITYEDNPENMGKDVIARAYMRYYDANGLLRTFYNDYSGTTVYGGCCTSYNAASELLPTEPIDYNNQITN
ncbi:MAG: hypothetical protein K6F88_02305 [Ruminococcus sp.]|nr:hypothetical protein [Ruminococcus sp.]